MHIPDLNRLGIPTDGAPVAQEDHGLTADAKVEVIFRNHRQRLIEEIGKHPVVVGCVAWLTDRLILSTLAKCSHVSIVVQKEDFLRPDLSGQRASDIRALYSALPAPLTRYVLPGTVSSLSVASDPYSDPVRCVGNHNSDKLPAWPRMHNKFLVFCDPPPPQKPWGDTPTIVPRKVWTGSYNITANAAQSWENAVLIDHEGVAEAYAKEFGQIFAFSEPLDWASQWVEPEYRIGT